MNFKDLRLEIGLAAILLLLMLEGQAFGNRTSFTLHLGVSQGLRAGEVGAILLLTERPVTF